MKDPKTDPTPPRYVWSLPVIAEDLERGYVEFDFYRLSEVLRLRSQPQIHAIKKLIRAGQSVKSTSQDINEAIDALRRWMEMLEEDASETAPVQSMQELNEKKK